MAENKRLAALLAGLVVSLLCAGGFANKAEAAHVGKESEVNAVKVIACMSESSCVNRTNERSMKKMPEIEIEEKQEISQKEQELLASIIFCEAGNQSYEGQVAVGAVVMNRVKSNIFPDTIEEVIYQSGQFTPACTGWLDQVKNEEVYTDSAMQAAADALAGVSPIGDCLYFDQGGSGMQIGAHYFH